MSYHIKLVPATSSTHFYISLPGKKCRICKQFYNELALQYNQPSVAREILEDKRSLDSYLIVVFF